MTIKDQIRYILRKHPPTRFSRGEFMWAWIEEMFGINVGITKSQFLEFWKQEAGLERALRTILLEEEFKLKPEQDSKRYEKSAGFKKEYKQIPILGVVKKDKKLGNKVVFNKTQ